MTRTKLTDAQVAARDYLESRGAHLSLREIECHCKPADPYPLERIEDGSLALVTDIFEAFRRRCGDEPLIVNCCFRNPVHNKEVGGGERSQHLLGRALDIACPTNRMAIDEFHRKAIEFAEQYATVGGLGLYRSFCHIDCRPRKADGRYAFWNES